MKTIKFVDYEKYVPPEEQPQSGAKLFFYLYATNFWDLFFLNILVVLLALPVVTLGPALAAANSPVLK